MENHQQHWKTEHLFDDRPYIKTPLTNVVHVEFWHDPIIDDSKLGFDERPIHLVKPEEPPELVA